MLFVSNINFAKNNFCIQKEKTTQKTSSPLLRQPAKDEVAFKSSKYELFEKALSKKNYIKDISFENMQPIIVNERQGSSFKPAEVLIAKVKGLYQPEYENLYEIKEVSALAIFSKDGKLLGDIKNLDMNDYKRNVISHVGKYLNLNTVNSYSKNHKGVGSALLDAAKDKSQELGLGGQLRAYAWNVFEPELGSPVPFYAKKGFVDINNPYMTKAELVNIYSRPENAREGADMFLLNPDILEKIKSRYK